jgi:hypothetical protein
MDFFVENMPDWKYFISLDRPKNSRSSAISRQLLTGAMPTRIPALPSHRLHLHDIHGTAGTHAAVGKGTIDFSGMMTVVRKYGVVSGVGVSTQLRDMGRIGVLDTC